MRRLSRGSTVGSQRGAISVLVAILMVVLLGFTALAVDAGMLYAERTQLRNGADAAALAVAQTCARDVNDPGCSNNSTLAASLANSNAGDGPSNVKSLLLNKTTRTVTVIAGAQEAGKQANNVSLFFARIFGINSAEVTAPSTVQWGSPVAGTTAFPMTFSICQVKGHVDGTLQLLQGHGNGDNPVTTVRPEPRSKAASAGSTLFRRLRRDDQPCGQEGGAIPVTAPRV